MKPAPLLGMLSLFALLCVGLIGGMNALTSGEALTAATLGAGGVSSTTLIIWDPSKQVGEDGGERTDEPRGSKDDDEDVATTTIDLTNIQIQLPDWYVPIIIPTSTPGTGATGTQPPVQPNDSAPRVLIAQPPVPTPVPVPRENPATSTELAGVIEREVENTRAQEMISDIGASLRQFQREVRRVENAVRDRVTREVENAFERAELTTQPKEPSTRAFDVDDRRRRIEALTAKLSQDVRSTIASGDESVGANELQPVLKSSLDELRLLIKADTGVDVDLSPSARTVLEVVSENTEQVSRAREELLGRGGLDLYEDSDKDGISNYDEQNIYNTDPQNAYTSGSFLTDGERVLLGFNVLTTDVAQVPVESPKVAGEVAENVFEVHAINVTLKPLDSAPAVGSSEKPDASILPAFKEEVTFSGRALPNSFVTLYVFSTPVVVTVKADASGAWSYTLDTELEDGTHELYVATVDAGGRILAKSPAVPFIKRAEAAEFTPLLIPETPEVTPLSLLQSNLTLVGIVAFIVFALIALIILGVLRAGPKDPTVAV